MSSLNARSRWVNPTVPSQTSRAQHTTNLRGVGMTTTEKTLSAHDVRRMQLALSYCYLTISPTDSAKIKTIKKKHIAPTRSGSLGIPRRRSNSTTLRWTRTPKLKFRNLHPVSLRWKLLSRKRVLSFHRPQQEQVTHSPDIHLPQPHAQVTSTHPNS